MGAVSFLGGAELKPLSVTRKADRIQMVEEVRKMWVASGCGKSITMTSQNPDDHTIRIDFEGPRATSLHLYLDGKNPNHKRGTWVLHWHKNGGESSKFSESFGDPNRIHWMKSTDVVWSFDQLLILLDRRFHQLVDGSAFQP